MSGSVTVNLSKPIVSAVVLDNYSDGIGTELSARDSGGRGEQILMQELEAQKALFSQSCQSLKGVVARLNEFCDKLFSEHKEEIAKLSVEIARKVLMQKVQEGDYEIESIVKEALKSAPERHDVVVHLNAEDFARCEKARQQNKTDGSLAGVKFISDDNIGRAECMVETPKGIIESLIEEHLERIGKALKKVK